ncbi:MAG TPA: hypothetical protein VL326_17970 [Kofleriaceae bacterium]|nr:hypothetical protein [Kofleriaceae bacterium]
MIVIASLAVVVFSSEPRLDAKPLPGGMKVVTKLGRPYIQQGSTTVALRDDDLADYEKITKAELAADGKTIVVTATRCSATLTADETKVPLTTIQARLDNAAGLVAMSKKSYAAAITKFSSAAQKDPETPAYTTNLLTAQTLGKKIDLAAQTLAMQGAKNPVWFAWQLATDPQLAPIKDHKRAKALYATTAGTAMLAKLGDRDIAVSDLAGGIAVMVTSSSGIVLPVAPPPPTKKPATKEPPPPEAQTAPAKAPTPLGTSELDFVSLSTGVLLARFPLRTLEDACDETDNLPCSDAAKLRIATRRALADQLLSTLGFTLQANAFIDVRNGDAVRKDGMTIEFADEGITATTKAGNEKTLAIDGSVWAVAITAKAVVIKVERRHLILCDDASSRTAGAALPL